MSNETKMSAEEKKETRESIQAAAGEWLKNLALSRDNLKYLADLFQALGNRVESRSWDIAKKIHRKLWFRVSKESSYQGLLSEGEVAKMLNSRGRESLYLKMARELDEILRGLRELFGFVDTIRAVCNRDTFVVLVLIDEEVRRHKGDIRHDSEFLRQNAIQAAEKFQAVNKVILNLAKLIPLPVFREYIIYNFKMLEGAAVIFDTVKNYSNRIIAELNELDKATNSMFNHPDSWFSKNNFLKNPHATDQLMDGKGNW